MIYQLATPRHDGPWRRRWRHRHTWRQLDLADRIRKDITRTDDAAPVVRLADRCHPIIHSSLN